MTVHTVVVRRLALSVPTISGIALLIFVILLLMPGNPAELIQGDMANPEVTRALIQRWGLDQPPLVRLGRWASSVLQLNLGDSLVTGRPVAEMLGPRLLHSLYLGLLGLGFGILSGIPIGILAATRPNSWLDYLVTTASLLGLSLPVFVTALLLQFLLAFRLPLFPISGAAPSLLSLSALHFAVLPAVSVASHQAAVIARMVRTLMLEIVHSDFIRTAHSKGLPELRVVFGHALPNVLIPVVTLLGVYMKSTISGLLLVEIVFGWPGVGRLFYDAVQQRDYPVIQGVALAIAIGVYAVNLLVDVAYSYLDPRVRVEGVAK